jgi:hypothetical protein
MNYFNHFTLNTRNNRKSFASEVDKDIVFRLMPVVKRAIETSGICDFIINETSIKITVEDNDTYAMTLFLGKESNPALISFGTINGKKRKEIIELSKPFEKMIKPTTSIRTVIPDAPVIVDILLPGIMERMDLLELTGDLSRCIAWIVLSSESIIVEK